MGIAADHGLERHGIVGGAVARGEASRAGKERGQIRAAGTGIFAAGDEPLAPGGGIEHFHGLLRRAPFYRGIVGKRVVDFQLFASDVDCGGVEGEDSEVRAGAKAASRRKEYEQHLFKVT